MWSSILMLTLLSDVMMYAVLLSDLAFIEAYLPIAARKIQIRERERRSIMRQVHRMCHRVEAIAATCFSVMAFSDL